ncbi:hypothetical protein BDZ89DRAFT_1037470 [Hymenopellis radicata]|nr:hypothetical protein BDZ89DRAFT_1037470 [Hymenopellis radicata]
MRMRTLTRRNILPPSIALKAGEAHTTWDVVVPARDGGAVRECKHNENDEWGEAVVAHCGLREEEEGVDKTVLARDEIMMMATLQIETTEAADGDGGDHHQRRERRGRLMSDT